MDFSAALSDVWKGARISHLHARWGINAELLFFFSWFLGVENCISYIHSLLCYLCFRAQVPVPGLRNVQFGDPANLSNVFFIFFSAVLSQLPDRHQTAESFMSPSAEHEALGKGNSRSALN